MPFPFVKPSLKIRPLFIFGLLAAAPLAVRGQAPAPKSPPRRLPTLLERSASAPELPLAPWGPYSRTHLAPCFLADGLNSQLFAFPVVVGQRRLESVLRPVGAAGKSGRVRIRSERVALERRLTHLSPMQAWEDDRPNPEIGAGWNRMARLREADAGGRGWSFGAAFLPAQVSQNVLETPDADGKMPAPAAWGAGEATVSYFPANVIPGGDGLLIRVALTNRSLAPQTYFIDLLGGMDAAAPGFLPADLTVERDPATDGMIVKHKNFAGVFALTSNASAFPQRSYRVGDAYFSPEGAVCSRSAAGAALPFGLLPEPADATAADDAKTEANRDAKPETKAAKQADTAKEKNEADKVGGRWGLLRVDEIALIPGETVTITFCVGIGKANDDAAEAAQALLAQCDDLLPDGTRRKGDGLATKAVNAHRAARFSSGSDAIDGLMAQSLCNAPESVSRRVGVPSRRETHGAAGGVYQAESGGWMALGWSGYRVDWSAAQMNAFFLTGGDLTPARDPQAIPPINLFALWELYQKTRDKAMLAEFYPFAKRRYQELTTAGRVESNRSLFAWPAPPERRDIVFVKSAKPEIRAVESSRAYAPDYSAYVIRSAKILRRMAEEIQQPAAETQQYGREIAAATEAMNRFLWDDLRDSYGSKRATGTPPESATGLAALLPLIAGDAVPPTRRAALLRRLSDPAAFWSDAGLRSLSRTAPDYFSSLASKGAVSFGANWLLWKALLDAGEAETAQKLAENLLQAYTAQFPLRRCSEALDGNTGAGFGATDYTGDSCALIALYQSYHAPGTVSAGWDIDLHGPRYDRETDILRVGWRSLNPDAAGKLLCVMARPGGKYRLSGSLTGLATADANGLLTLTAPKDSTTQALEIAPL